MDISHIFTYNNNFRGELDKVWFDREYQQRSAQAAEALAVYGVASAARRAVAFEHELGLLTREGPRPSTVQLPFCWYLSKRQKGSAICHVFG